MKRFNLTERFTPRNSISLGYYYTDIEKQSLISSEEEADLAWKSKNGDLEARDKLIKANLRFVISVAKMYANNPDFYEDLIASGNLGLIQAAERFDPSRGFRFISFAVWYIRKEMLQYLNENSKMIKLPINKVQDMVRIVKATEELRKILQKEPDREEIVEYVTRKQEKPFLKTRDEDAIRDLLDQDYPIASMDSPIIFKKDLNEDLTLYDVMENPDEKPDSALEQIDLDIEINTLLSVLSPLEKTIVKLKHGMGDIRLDGTHASVAKFMNMRESKVRWIYGLAIKKMKAFAKRNKIEEKIF